MLNSLAFTVSKQRQVLCALRWSHLRIDWLQIRIHPMRIDLTQYFSLKAIYCHQFTVLEVHAIHRHTFQSLDRNVIDRTISNLALTRDPLHCPFNLPIMTVSCLLSKYCSALSFIYHTGALRIEKAHWLHCSAHNFIAVHNNLLLKKFEGDF